MRASLIQLQATTDKAHNLQQTKQLMLAALADKPDIIVLPEMFNFLCGEPSQRMQQAEMTGYGQSYRFLQQFARKHQVLIHGGSICETDGKHYFNTSFIFDKNGNQLASYRKIHLFDVKLPNGFAYQESEFYQAGTDLVLYDIDVYKVGCTICFDLRFADQFLALAQRGADVIMVPSAFTYQTGQAHWEILLRARAIETQTFVLAAGQTGEYLYKGERRASWGHTMAVDPWGNVLGELGSEIGHLTVDLDFSLQQKVRERMPMLQLQRELAVIK